MFVGTGGGVSNSEWNEPNKTTTFVFAVFVFASFPAVRFPAGFMLAMCSFFARIHYLTESPFAEGGQPPLSMKLALAR